jgi:hypothetical protein
MSSFSTEHSSSAIRLHEGQSNRVVRARRRRDLLAAAGLAIVAAGTGVVAIEARAGGGSAHGTLAPKPVLAVSSVGVVPGSSGTAHAPGSSATAQAAVALSEARAAHVALARNAVAMQSVGAAGRTALLLKALPPVRVPVKHAAVPPTSTATPTPTAPVPAQTYSTPAAPAPTYTAPTYTPPAAPAPTYTAPTPTPTPAPSTGAGSTGGGSSSSGSGSVSGGG